MGKQHFANSAPEHCRSPATMVVTAIGAQEKQAMGCAERPRAGCNNATKSGLFRGVFHVPWLAKDRSAYAGDAERALAHIAASRDGSHSHSAHGKGELRDAAAQACGRAEQCLGKAATGRRGGLMFPIRFSNSCSLTQTMRAGWSCFRSGKLRRSKAAQPGLLLSSFRLRVSGPSR